MVMWNIVSATQILSCLHVIIATDFSQSLFQIHCKADCYSRCWQLLGVCNLSLAGLDPLAHPLASGLAHMLAIAILFPPVRPLKCPGGMPNFLCSAFKIRS